jgi:hypothetical protein
VKTSPSQITAAYKVGWSPVNMFITIDGDEVLWFGLDAFMNRYYRTAKATYIKHANYWIRITP